MKKKASHAWGEQARPVGQHSWSGGRNRHVLGTGKGGGHVVSHNPKVPQITLREARVWEAQAGGGELQRLLARLRAAEGENASAGQKRGDHVW